MSGTIQNPTPPKQGAQEVKRVLAVVVNYDGLEDTLECVESLLASTLVPTILVVDAHSEADELKRIQEAFPQVDGIRLQSNLGYANAINTGLRWAIEHRFDFVAVMNNDTVVAPKLFETLFKASEPKSLLVPIICGYANREKVWYGGGEINRVTGGVKHLGMGGKEIPQQDFYCTFATGCFWWMPVAIVREVGFLSEDFYMYCEDADYSIRLQEAGFKIKVVVKAKVFHKISQRTGGSTSAFQNYYISRNRLLCVTRHKAYYAVMAELFTLIGRSFRYIKYWKRRNIAYKAIADGVLDYFKGKTGRSNRYVV